MQLRAKEALGSGHRTEKKDGRDPLNKKPQLHPAAVSTWALPLVFMKFKLLSFLKEDHIYHFMKIKLIYVLLN